MSKHKAVKEKKPKEKKPKEPKEEKPKEFDSDEVRDEVDVVQEWKEPFPASGLVKVKFLVDSGLSVDGRVQQVKAGDIRVIDAEVAHSRHKSISGVDLG